MSSRQWILDRWGPGGIIQIPAENYFHDLEKTQIKLCYAANLEYQLSLIQVQRLMKFSHTVTFVNFGEPMEQVIAAIRFSERFYKRFASQSFQDMKPVISEGTPCAIEWRDETEESPRKCTGMVFLDIFDFPFQSDLIVSVTGRKRTGSKGFLNQYPVSDETRSYPCTLAFETLDDCVRTQINTINTMCSDARKEWHQAILNHEPSALPRVNVFDGIPEDDVAAAYKEIAQLKP
ncbi:hypothetical protein P170DRAFT_8870 [Aspergillus steynii IBT 23096]|uniref:Uncharacterized protein n=1 Tax=Aspergillus steynii IBT 23096 TaxID=1392250 RepID=A0A2I2GMN5_9EURO|nr:uncharacterized protein P170DRAFT_8870 [Aspergillus steynii IBT 23096]PLB54136.1 hypothetical protein P170DRAFT_8870 [Aspergillus steynii IBT 23096]